ncbi:hypothetical protein QTP70_012703 [Hemibagrus guttatus]|uniref:ribonuclease H n=1 Tax=Hemibagrus guttatus TaxID=175788 RepID=A0AAE0RGE0_9TELE|nr:hypothetical protein QTP70_012703 [Hemibagrus guttatus]KAK3572974.1 hypothetical protein QTP86_011823 [Hemibagrus guttatus]
MVMDQLSEEVRQESPWTMMFADDIVICSESREQVEENLESWRFALDRRGIKFSHNKSEYMCVNEMEGSGTVGLQGEEVKKVQEFKYLGSTVQSNGECGKEVKKQVQAGWNGWRKVSGVLCDRKISARMKGKVYRTVVRPAMLYGLETVSLRKRQESELEVAELKMLRFSLGVTRLDRIRNEYIRGIAHVGRLGDKVREARLRWFGHVQRRESEYIGRRMLDMELPGRRQRGRPKRRYMDAINEDMKLVGASARMQKIGIGGERLQFSIQHLIEKLSLLGTNTSLCNWILDFLTGRPQSVRIANSICSTTTLSTRAPQGCVLSLLLFTLLTHDHIIKFANDTTVVGLISKNNESAYREEVQRLTAWCKANNLSLNVKKTKEMVVDFRRAQSDHSPLNIDRSNLELVKSTKFLGVHLAEDLTWSRNTSSITKKTQQHLYFLRRLWKAHLPPPILTTFYRGTIESILSSCITAWFGTCTVSDRKTLQRIVRTAEKIIAVSLPSITDIYSTRCIRKANSIVNDSTHPSHTLFTLLPSGKRYQSIRNNTTRLLNSFFPQAIRCLNRELI